MQISHPNLGSPNAMVTPYAELVVTGSRAVGTTNLLGNVQLYSGLHGPIGVDKSSYAIPIIGYEHHEIHDGNHFYLSNYSIIGSGLGSSLFFGVTTPNGSKWIHLTYGISSTLVTQSKLYEGATLSGGTAVNCWNSNRNSLNTCSVNIRYRPTISGVTPTSGTLITASSWGTATATPSKQGVGGQEIRNNELILKSGTTYLIQITSASADNLISYDANWYEHTDKVKQF